MVVIATRASAAATAHTTGSSDRIIFATFGLTLLQYAFPFARNREGELLLIGSQFTARGLSSSAHPRPTIVIFLTRMTNLAPATISAVRHKTTDSVGAPVSGMAKA